MVPEFKGLTFPRSTDGPIEHTDGIRSVANLNVQVEGLPWRSVIVDDTFRVAKLSDPL